MKILLVSMKSIHFTRWTDQLKESGHEVYWFDILDGGYTPKLPWVNQITGWKQKYPKMRGRIFIKKNFPFLYKKLSFLIERNTAKRFEEVLNEVQPDVVHSIVLYISCAPILEVMKKRSDLPWIYSSWGSDLYYYKEKKSFRKDIEAVLPRVNYLITDCQRDVGIAKELGFSGDVLGVFPGGGGFNYLDTNDFIVTLSERRTILVKGYQGRSGRAIPVLKALIKIADKLKNYKIIVFGSDDEVIKYAEKNAVDDLLNIVILSRSKMLPHKEIMKLMGESLIYIGNSNSDGMPNTLLEAISMGAFPIQSNPGGATEEVITHGKNGFLIQDHEDVETIKDLILKSYTNDALIDNAFNINQIKIKPLYEREAVTKKVLKAYRRVEKEL